MKQVTIEAFDKDGNKLGEQVEDQPETMAELLDQFEEKDIVSMVWRSHAIDVQRELRSKARGPKTETAELKAFKKLTPEQQAALLAQLANS
jgi:hypothetical protein